MYNRTMAVNSVAFAPKGQNGGFPERKGRLPMAKLSRREYQDLRIACARALAQGFRPYQVGRALASKFAPQAELKGRDLEKWAMKKIRSWMRDDSEFRDLIYEIAVVELDLKTPLIFGGLAQSAMKGRVDAAKLALEITGRHTSQAQTVTAVQINLRNVDRPAIDSAQTEG